VVVERRRVVAHGFVQGVSFRDTLRQAALRHRVAGWVRNRGDGSVEAVFEGAPDDVERFEVWEEPVEGVSGFSIVG
jgi:acylphosphatase